MCIREVTDTKNIQHKESLNVAMSSVLLFILFKSVLSGLILCLVISLQGQTPLFLLRFQLEDGLSEPDAPLLCEAQMLDDIRK